MEGKASNLYVEIFKQLSAGALVVDHNGVVILANQGFVKLSGFEQKEIIGEKLDNFLEGSYQLRKNWQGEVCVKRKGKEDFLQLLYTEPVKDSNDHIIYTVLLIRDFNYFGIDPLTKLPNRFLLEQKLNIAIKKAQEKCIYAAVLFIDLDRFKFVNDTLGHACGDLLLQEAAKRIKKAINGGDFIVRMGGDEFICILEDLKDEEEAETIAKKMIKSFSKPFQLKETEIFVTLSIGISIFPYDGDEEEVLITNADAAIHYLYLFQYPL